MKKCKKCKGTGYVYTEKNYWGGLVFLPKKTKCLKCDGRVSTR